MTRAFNIDCMTAMAEMEDNQFDLAIVDPPYGIKEGAERIKSRHHSQKKYHVGDWDNDPADTPYFKELIRVSKNQIIWGANHFIENIPNANSPCWIIWDKDTGSCDFADGELAYTSYKTAVRIFKFTWNGFRQGYVKNELRIHPTQKPIALYKWLLKNYAKEGDSILDTHLGSGSSRIAAHEMGFDFTGYEIDKDYFDAQEIRFNTHIQQKSMFNPKDMYQ